MTTEPSEDRAARARPWRAVVAAVVVVALAVGAALLLGGGDDAATMSSRGLELSSAGGTSGTDATAALSEDLVLPITHFRYVAGDDLAAPADHAAVWRLEPDTVDEARVAEWAKVLGVQGQVIPTTTGSDTTGWRVEDGDRLLNVDRQGREVWFSFQSGRDGASSAGVACAVAPDSGIGVDLGTGADGNTGTASEIDPACEVPSPEPPEPPTALPTADEARAIGERLLRELGVLSGAWEFDVRDSGSVSASASCVVGATECVDTVEAPYISSRALVARPLVDGTAVDSVEWSVDIGDAGEVLSVFGSPASLVAESDHALAPLDAVLAGMNDGTWPGMITPLADIGTSPACVECPDTTVTVTIERVELGWQRWFGGDTASTSYVVPTYRFEGRDDSGAPWSTEVVALTRDAFAIPTP